MPTDKDKIQQRYSEIHELLRTFFAPITGLVAIYGVLVAMIASVLWVSVRDTPTLRSRRFRVYSIFWIFQYFILFVIAYTWCGGAIMDWLSPRSGCCGPRVNPVAGLAVFLCIFVPIVLLCSFLFQSRLRRLKGIVENDLGLPGQRFESYTYPQVERRFSLSFLTNLLLALAVHVAFVGNVLIFSNDVSRLSFLFLAQIFGGLLVIAVIATLYYSLGRQLLELCHTRQKFLASPPLVDEPFETILKKCGLVLDTSHVEAIARFDPVTMTEDEPEIAARPFPRSWLWIGGFYVVLMFTIFCLALESPNSYSPRALLKQVGIIHDYTVPSDFVPWNAERYHRRGMRAINDEPQRAIEEFSIAIRLNPRFADAYLWRAHAWLRLSAGEKALADMTEAIRVSAPSSGHYYIMRAMMYEELGEPEKAAADWEKGR